MIESSKENVIALPKKRGRKKKVVNEEIKQDSLGLVVRIPLDALDVEKLKNLLSAKEELFKKAMNVDDLKFEVDGEDALFPWFKDDIQPEDIMIFTRFISALCKMSKDSSRINPHQKEVVNEKYAFRCFLLRLGYIGDDYKADRKLLLRNFTGSAAFKTKKIGE